MVTKTDFISLPLSLENFIEALKQYNELTTNAIELSAFILPTETPESYICQVAAKLAVQEFFKRAVPATGRDSLFYDLRIGNVRIDVRNKIAPRDPEPTGILSVPIHRTAKARHGFIFTRMVAAKMAIPEAFTFQHKVTSTQMVSLATLLKDHYKKLIILGYSNLETYLAGANEVKVGDTLITGTRSKDHTFEKDISSLTPIRQVMAHYENLTEHRISV